MAARVRPRTGARAPSGLSASWTTRPGVSWRGPPAPKPRSSCSPPMEPRCCRAPWTLKADDGPFSIQVPETGGIASGDYAVRVRLRSQADEKTELTDTARVVLRDGPALGEAVMWRRGPSTGPRYLRTADPRFMRSDRLRLELATSAATPATARILDRNGNELSVPAQVSERADSSGAFRWIVDRCAAGAVCRGRLCRRGDTGRGEAGHRVQHGPLTLNLVVGLWALGRAGNRLSADREGDVQGVTGAPSKPSCRRGSRPSPCGTLRTAAPSSARCARLAAS